MAGERAQLDAALRYVRKGDTLVVTKIDRLARSITKLMLLVEQLSAKGVALRILDPDINTGGPMGKLVLTLLGGIAEFERSIMLERQREGIAKAKAEGKFKGRKPTARAKADQVRALRAGGAGATEIANRLGIGRQSVYRILGEAGG
jgi:DNA invertase Pin-like site-specific DNA recombinase